ncbi:MAG: DUF3108 domain-containing protein [Deltaproteobacteria bacterium]|nr:DUF3108 domain-containing protein [Deltaproteobacteria bacterium]
MQLQIKNILFFVFFLAFIPFNVSHAGDCKYLPDFEAYYKFKFTNGITVASGVLKGEKYGKQYKMDFQGKTTKFISLFYKVEGCVRGSVDINTLQPINCVYSEKKPGKSKIVTVKYIDEHKAVVKMTKIKASKIKNRNKTLILKESIFSPISLYVFFMRADFQLNKNYCKYIVISDDIHKVETVPLKVKQGKTKVRVRIFRMKNGKVDASKKVEEIHAWVNNLKIPVKMEYRFGMGTVECNLKRLIIKN